MPATPKSRRNQLRTLRIAMPAARPRAKLRMPPRGALALALADWARSSGARGLLHVSAEAASLHALAEMARGFAPELEVLVLPPWDSVPYDRARPTRTATAARVAALFHLAIRSKEPVLVFTSASALPQRAPPRARLVGREVTIRTGMAIEPEWLAATLEAFGYAFDDRVDEPGDAAVRGGTIDIFPAGRAEPVRLEMNGRTIVDIRAFDPLDQRSTGAIATISLLPVAEAFTLPGEEVAGVRGRLLPPGPLETLFDYLPEAALSLEPAVEERITARIDLVHDGYEARRLAHQTSDGDGAIDPPDRLYLTGDEIASALAGRKVMQFDDHAGDEVAERIAESDTDTPERVAALGRSRAQAGDAVIFCIPERESALLRKIGLRHRVLDGWHEAEGLAAGEVGILRLHFTESFRLDGLSVLAAPGAGRQIQRNDANAALLAQDLRIGDVVVEPTHGLARLSGLVMVDEAGAGGECLVLEFAGDKRLLLPATQAGEIWRYGSADASVRPDSLTGEAWLKRRQQVEEEIAEAAAGIVARARARETEKAPAITPKPSEFARFGRRVPYTLTADQDRAIAATLRDLGRGRPMDRLVCGDVAFGKTEVALHAAAAAVLAGKQVAVIAPTTLLARQHLETFRRRFSGLGVAIDKLIRSTKSVEGRQVTRGLAEGAVRIAIGTHALAAPGLAFEDLGLVIIDEEQRFGEAQKRRLRASGAGRHVLTLTATPLPRSLQAALVGLVDVSVLTTPPVARQAVRGFVTSFDRATVRGALLREARRGGQSFVVCPRIEDLAPMQARLVELVPEMSIAVAHGRMRADALDAVMLDFAEGRGDVLLTTNIIEAGLDIPNANTMLVWRPDRFGLAQLHQLRGRVGRGRTRGTVYLLTDPEQRLTEAARKRLARLVALDRPGAGFAISAADLDLRGAGDLLGEAQAGHVRLVGTELYRHLLLRALATARGEAVPAEWRSDVTLGVAAFIPVDLVPDADVRLEIYRRLDRVQTLDEADELAHELADRFGQLPQPALSLLDLKRLGLLCRRLGIASLQAGPQAVAVVPREEIDLSALAKGFSGRIKTHLRGERLILEIAESEPQHRLSLVLDALVTAKTAPPDRMAAPA